MPRAEARGSLLASYIILKPNEICPYTDVCPFLDNLKMCGGASERNNEFICNLEKLRSIYESKDLKK